MAQPHQVNTDTDALVAIDVQNDFCPDGALPVPQGDEVVPILDQWLAVKALFAVATRDWHPTNHSSFKRHGGPWPDHCVQGSSGAEFHPDLNAEAIDVVISTGSAPEADGYSGFDGPELLEALQKRDITRLWMGGLATEYCVKATVLAGRQKGFEVFVIEDAIRGIEATPGDCDKARKEMEDAGAVLVRSDEVEKTPQRS